MKKLLAFVLVFVMVLCLAACQQTPAAGTEETPKNTVTATEPAATAGAQVTEPAGTEAASGVVYAFTFSGKVLIPGEKFQTATLPAADFVYEVPSCAIEGTDQVYNYGILELTAFDDGTGAVIYSIFLLDANTPTDEGLYLGDPISVMTQLYGEDYQVDGNQYIYANDTVMLVILAQDGYVASIEYKMISE